VAEHIHPDFADTLVDSLTCHGRLVLVSAARPGQGGCGHLNEQMPEYWVEKFAARGFAHDPESTALFQQLGENFCDNILVFRQVGRGDLATPQKARGIGHNESLP